MEFIRETAFVLGVIAVLGYAELGPRHPKPQDAERRPVAGMASSQAAGRWVAPWLTTARYKPESQRRTWRAEFGRELQPSNEE